MSIQITLPKTGSVVIANEDVYSSFSINFSHENGIYKSHEEPVLCAKKGDKGVVVGFDGISNIPIVNWDMTSKEIIGYQVKSNNIEVITDSVSCGFRKYTIGFEQENNCLFIKHWQGTCGGELIFSDYSIEDLVQLKEIIERKIMLFKILEIQEESKKQDL